MTARAGPRPSAPSWRRPRRFARRILRGPSSSPRTTTAPSSAIMVSGEVVGMTMVAIIGDGIIAAMATTLTAPAGYISAMVYRKGQLTRHLALWCFRSAEDADVLYGQYYPYASGHKHKADDNKYGLAQDSRHGLNIVSSKIPTKHTNQKNY
jgi:hypothetical protein